jgi:hypothetical protein
MKYEDTCQIRVSPNSSIKPNLGGIELAEALSRVIPFAAKEDDRPVLGCVRFAQKDGKLTLTSADGFRLAEVSLDFEDGEGEALIPAKELRGLTAALKEVRWKMSQKTLRDRDSFKDLYRGIHEAPEATSSPLHFPQAWPAPLHHLG